MKLDRVRTVIAVTLAAALTFSLVPAPVLAGDTGEILGRVVLTDRVTAMSGVTIVLVDPEMSRSDSRALPLFEMENEQTGRWTDRLY